VSGPFAIAGSGLKRVVFALCNGAVNTFGQCSAPGPFYTDRTGTPSTNVRTLSGAEWNTALAASPNPAEGSSTARSVVFGFEDENLQASDQDFNDVVFSTNLQVVPEPSTYALMGAGLVGLFAVARRRRNRA
jgi:hypothetical protein